MLISRKINNVITMTLFLSILYLISIDKFIFMVKEYVFEYSVVSLEKKNTPKLYVYTYTYIYIYTYVCIYNFLVVWAF